MYDMRATKSYCGVVSRVRKDVAVGLGQRGSTLLPETRLIGVVAEGVGFEPTTGFPL